jgi:hypothetical protein
MEAESPLTAATNGPAFAHFSAEGDARAQVHLRKQLIKKICLVVAIHQRSRPDVIARYFLAGRMVLFAGLPALRKRVCGFP